LVPAPGGTWGAEEFEPRVDGGQVLSTSTPVLAGRLRYDPREWLRPEPAPSAELTQLPANLADPLAELAGGILGATQEPRDQAERLERHFREAFDYSLETDLAGREHPLLVLVRERRPASCGYFAAAYVLLLRSRGVPARVVTGYLSPPANRWTGGVTLREADAHAWAEVYLPGEERWVAFDPTPAESRGTWHGVTEARGSGWWGGWGELRRGVESWSRRRWLAWRRDPLGATARGLAWGLGALFVGWLGWRVWRRRGVRGSGVKPMSWEAPDGRLRESRVVFLESLAALGMPFDPAESDEERLARLSRVASPAICARAERFLAMYHAARYGGGEPSGELLTAARVNSPVSGGTRSDSEPGVRAG